MNQFYELQPHNTPTSVIFFDLSRAEKRAINEAAAAAAAKMKPATWAKQAALSTARAAAKEARS